MTYYFKKDAIMANLQLQIENQEKLQNKLSGYDYAVNNTNSVVDNSTASDRLADTHLQYRRLRDMVYEITNNDPSIAEDVLNQFDELAITAASFSTVFSEAKRNFKGRDAPANDIVTNIDQLLDNYMETGNASQSSININNNDVKDGLEQIIAMIQNAASDGTIPEKEGEDLVDRTDALAHIYEMLQVNPNQDVHYSKLSIKDKTMGRGEIKDSVDALMELLVSSKKPQTKLDEIIIILHKIKQSTFKTIGILETRPIDQTPKKLKKKKQKQTTPRQVDYKTVSEESEGYQTVE